MRFIVCFSLDGAKVASDVAVISWEGRMERRVELQRIQVELIRSYQAHSLTADGLTNPQFILVSYDCLRGRFSYFVCPSDGG